MAAGPIAGPLSLLGRLGRRRQHFENLSRDAPDFVPALTSLVQLHNTEHIAHPGRFRNRTKYPETVQKARRAARLDPLDPRAQLNLAWTHQLDGRIYKSTLYAALAAELNGNDPGR